MFGISVRHENLMCATDYLPGLDHERLRSAKAHECLAACYLVQLVERVVEIEKREKREGGVALGATPTERVCQIAQVILRTGAHQHLTHLVQLGHVCRVAGALRVPASTTRLHAGFR